ncbi:hypothetical protein RRSWK_00253 [Rhodopirellula sp. SWK7]|nr:hypothetical protein RRSWK_00253 [Rhodopirellula sp. SWK7]
MREARAFEPSSGYRDALARIFQGGYARVSSVHRLTRLPVAGGELPAFNVWSGIRPVRCNRSRQFASLSPRASLATRRGDAFVQPSFRFGLHR